jgi:hypothetical protein
MRRKAMLKGHSTFYLSQPAIYFGIHELYEEDADPESEIDAFQYGTAPYDLKSFIQQKPAMYIHWTDAPS